MNMKDMIQRMTDLESQAKQQLTENVNECGDMPMNPPMDQGSPVSMNVNISASGKDHVADLIDMMKNAGLNTAAPVSQDMMPMRMDMEKFRGIVDQPEKDGKLDLDMDGDRQPDLDTEELDIKEDAMDLSDKSEELSQWLAKYDDYRGDNGDALPMGWIKSMTATGVGPDGWEVKEWNAYQDKLGKDITDMDDAEIDAFIDNPQNSPVTSAMIDDLLKITGASEADEDLARAVSSAIGIGEGYENEPKPDYRDHHHMTKDLSGGLNRQKKAYPAAQDGDNAMAAKIKEQLLAALSEKKMPMGPGPDGKKGTDDDKPAFLNQKTGDKKSKSDKKDGGMTDKQKKYFGKK